MDRASVIQGFEGSGLQETGKVSRAPRPAERGFILSIFLAFVRVVFCFCFAFLGFPNPAWWP